MKKGALVFFAVLALCTAFLLGWRVMPHIWPNIRETVVYTAFPQLRPAPKSVSGPNPESELYVPESSAALNDEISTTDSLIYYFYKDYCPYCRELDPLIAGLPTKITLPDGTVSEVKLVCINKVEEHGLELITGYYESHNIPEKRRYVPAIVIGDRYLFTSTDIVPQLLEALVSGDGLTTPLIDGSDRVDLQ